MSLPILISNFCFETIQGHESGMYKVLATQNSLDILKDTRALGFIKHATINYLNAAYVSLIKKNDPYIVNKFDEMCKIHHHSSVCLLNVIMLILTSVHYSLDRSKLNVTSYNAYMKSLQNQLDAVKDVTIKSITNSISHECHGIDISTCDPYKPMFF